MVAAIVAGANVRRAATASRGSRGSGVRRLLCPVGTIVPGLFQRLVVKPDELQREKPYIEHNIAFTQQAYNLRQVSAKPFPAEQDLTLKALEANKATLTISGSGTGSR